MLERASDEEALRICRRFLLYLRGKRTKILNLVEQYASEFLTVKVLRISCSSTKTRIRKIATQGLFAPTQIAAISMCGGCRLPVHCR
jgi:hypothetical protein